MSYVSLGAGEGAFMPASVRAARNNFKSKKKMGGEHKLSIKHHLSYDRVLCVAKS